jgi:serine/threonine protein kinase
MSLSKLGRYDIIRVLGKGSMGLLYEARDPNLDRRVAIKTIKVENLSASAAADYDARFKTEARSAARLQHPNIVSVYDSDYHGDMAYLVMEFIQGEDLKNYLDGGKRYSFEQSLRMVAELLSALDYAHRQNVVHRDVKPANLLIETDGRLKLTDFGVARIQDSGEPTKTQGTMVGTLKYMSPEQVQGLLVDARTDLFAVGVVLYQLLTGKRPFDGDTDFAIIQQVVGRIPAAPSSINTLLPPAIDAVVERALAKRRDQRFPTAQAFLVALQEAGAQATDLSGLAPISFPVSVERAMVGSDHQGHSGDTTIKVGAFGLDPGSTVSQEMELVYWKDIRESEEVEDLQGFLLRFPSGIYVDLARRRLKKLAEVTKTDPELVDAAGPPEGPAGWLPKPGLSDRVSPVIAPSRFLRHSVPDKYPDTAPVGADMLTPSKTESSYSVAAADLFSNMPVFALVTGGVVLAVLLFAGLAFKLLPGAMEAEKSRASTFPTATGSLPFEEFLPDRKSVGVSGDEIRMPAARADSKRPVKTLPTLAPVRSSAALDPAQACKDRILLGFQFCMTEQCAKPAFIEHPVCVNRARMEKARRDASLMRR